MFRKSCTRAGGLNDEAISAIVNEKRQLLRRTPALAFHEAEGGLAEVGGLGELKHWLRDRRRAFVEIEQGERAGVGRVALSHADFRPVVAGEPGKPHVVDIAEEGVVLADL